MNKIKNKGLKFIESKIKKPKTTPEEAEDKLVINAIKFTTLMLIMTIFAFKSKAFLIAILLLIFIIVVWCITLIKLNNKEIKEKIIKKINDKKDVNDVE